MRRSSTVVIGALTASLIVYALLPFSAGSRSYVYDAIAFAALSVAWVTVLRRGAGAAARGWVLVLGGFTVWVAGDLVWSVEQYVLHRTGYPGYSDVLYLSGYGSLIAGCQVFVRRRREGRDVTALLDAAIVAAGVAVPAIVFVITPVTSDSSLSLLGKLVSSFYPIGDIVLLAMVVRLIATPGGRSWSFAFTSGALLATLAADTWWNAAIIVTSFPDTNRWMELTWLSSYVLIAAAVLHPSMRGLGEASPPGVDVASHRRLLLLGLASLLPAATLAAAGLAGSRVPWLTVSFGGAVLTSLVLVRMAGLLDRVREQAVQLSVLARSDSLTGAPNRRTWDHELARACDLARDSGVPLSVAMLDLDHFKQYNDLHGHQAGDRLLVEAVAAWTARLGPDVMLARYGGEEFAVLLPGVSPELAVSVLDGLRSVTPAGQTLSAGVVGWVDSADASDILAAADSALYEAKRQGRDRVVLAAAHPAPRRQPIAG